MSVFRKIVKRILYPNYYSNEAYIHYLQNSGAKIGEETVFYDPVLKPVDETSLPFIEIGSRCRITRGVLILAHDYSYSTLRPVYHKMLLKSGITSIGNNVFIGMNSIILMNTTIGDNVIIGAGSVVSGCVPSNCVIGGNPAKVICTLDEYYVKLNDCYLDNAKIYYLRKRDFLKRELSEDEMFWYNSLWGNPSSKIDYFRSLKVDGDSSEEIAIDMISLSKPIFKSFSDFVEWASN